MAKIAIVTGSSSGLGLKTVESLLSENYIVYAWDINPLTISSPNLIFSKVNVTSTKSISDALNLITATHSKIDVLVNAAGIAPVRKTLYIPVSEFEKVVKVNLIGTFDVCRQVAPFMSNGVIIIVASINAKQGTTGLAAYSASKGGVLGLALPMARELASKQVRVVCISPGGFDTPMMGVLSDKVKASISKTIPSGRLGRPEEFAHAVLFVIRNEYLNGCDLEINGGTVNPNL